MKKLPKKLKLVSEFSTTKDASTSKDDISSKDASKTTRRTARPKMDVIVDDIDLNQIIGDTKISSRLPVPEKKIVLRANAYYMNNREVFINFINALLDPIKKNFNKQNQLLHVTALSMLNLHYLLIKKLFVITLIYTRPIEDCYCIMV